ncbi:MAG TPA: hypothetical protein VGH89_12490 [Pseudonocardia sp.]
MSRPTGESASAADLAALRTQVTPENVMLLHHGLLAEAQYMREQIAMHLHPVGEPGKDLVSPQAAVAFNSKINNLREQLLGYVNALRTMTEEMAATAQRYGHTESEITASFAKFNNDYKRSLGRG